MKLGKKKKNPKPNCLDSIILRPAELEAVFSLDMLETTGAVIRNTTSFIAKTDKNCSPLYSHTEKRPFKVNLRALLCKKLEVTMGVHISRKRGSPSYSVVTRF